MATYEAGGLRLRLIRPTALRSALVAGAAVGGDDALDLVADIVALAAFAGRRFRERLGRGEIGAGFLLARRRGAAVLDEYVHGLSDSREDRALQGFLVRLGGGRA